MRFFYIVVFVLLLKKFLFLMLFNTTSQQKDSSFQLVYLKPGFYEKIEQILEHEKYQNINYWFLYPTFDFTNQPVDTIWIINNSISFPSNIDGLSCCIINNNVIWVYEKKLKDKNPFIRKLPYYITFSQKNHNKQNENSSVEIEDEIDVQWVIKKDTILKDI